MERPVVTMGPLATKIAELEGKLYDLRSQVADMESKQRLNRKRLRPSTVREIREMWDNGFSADHIASEFRINRGTAYRIGTRQYHKGII